MWVRTYVIADDVGVVVGRQYAPNDLHLQLVVPEMFEYFTHSSVVASSIHNELEVCLHRGLLEVLFLIGQPTIVFEPVHVFTQHEGEVAGIQPLDMGLRLRAQAGRYLLGEEPFGQGR